MHPSVVIGVLVLATAYVWLGASLHRRIPRRRWLAFAAALVTILIALGPLDELADGRLFTAHMAQHLLITLVMPPLLLLGIPEWMFRWALRWRGVLPVARRIASPLLAFGLYNGLLVVVHTPWVFESMLRDGDVHVAVHLGLMITGTIMWWPLLSPLPELPRLSYPAQMLYLFVLMIPMAAVSAPITLSPAVIYPWYTEGPHPWGISPFNDQIIGGLLMWVGASTYLLCVSTFIFFRWARYDDRDEPRVGRPRLVPSGGAVRLH